MIYFIFPDFNEYKVFKETYPQLMKTLTDIDDLLTYFVARNIITMRQEDDIKQLSVPQERVRRLLLIISGPLESGDKNGFYVLLDIMKNHGTQSTQDLAENILSKLRPNVDAWLYEYLAMFVFLLFLHNF